jgi:hypothetical protein
MREDVWFEKRDRERGRGGERERERKGHRERERERERDTQREKQTERERERETGLTSIVKSQQGSCRRSKRFSRCKHCTVETPKDKTDRFTHSISYTHTHTLSY